VMGPVMKTASMKPEVALLDNEELGGVEDDSEDWQFVQLGEQQNFGIKTAGLEDKATELLRFLILKLNELKPLNHPKIHPVMELMDTICLMDFVGCWEILLALFHLRRLHLQY